MGDAGALGGLERLGRVRLRLGERGLPGRAAAARDGGCAGGGRADHGAHRNPAADLQRGPGADPGGRAVNRRGSGAAGPGRPLRPLHPQRHPRRGDRDGGGHRPLTPAAAAGGRAGALLPPPQGQHRPQGRQHRRLGRDPRRRLRLHAGARRRQPDVGRDDRGADRRDAARPGARPRADRADRGQRRDAVRAAAAVRLAALRPGVRPGPGLVVGLGGQLLGPQCPHPGGRVRRERRAAAPDRPQAVRRPHPQPRLHRGRAVAPPRLGGAHVRRPAGQLRGDAADAARHRGARPALVPGQPAARAGADGRRPALGEPAAPGAGHLRLPRAAALAGAGGLRGDHLALAAPRTRLGRLQRGDWALRLHAGAAGRAEGDGADAGAGLGAAPGAASAAPGGCGWGSRSSAWPRC